MNTKSDKIVIKIEELPLRTQPLNPKVVSEIFGGCNDSGATCFASSECCYQDCWLFECV
jgi:hypothetical protein